MENWEVIFKSNEIFKLKLAEDVLKQNGIESHIVSQKDSAFPSIGEGVLMTPPDRLEEALNILQENELIS